MLRRGMVGATGRSIALAWYDMRGSLNVVYAELSALFIQSHVLCWISAFSTFAQ